MPSQMIDAPNFPLNTPSKSVSQQQIPTEHLSFVDQKMFEAFGATLTNSEGKNRSGYSDEKIWERAATLRGRVYRLPGGIVGREFTNLLADEYDLLASAKNTSERVSMFGKLILQKDKNIRKSPDIKRLFRGECKCGVIICLNNSFLKLSFVTKNFQNQYQKWMTMKQY